MGYSPISERPKAESQDRSLKQKLQRNVVYWPDLLPSLYFRILLANACGIALSHLALPTTISITAISNQRNTWQACAQPNLMEALP